MSRSTNSLAFLVGVLVSGDYGRLAGAVNDYTINPSARSSTLRV